MNTGGRLFHVGPNEAWTDGKQQRLATIKIRIRNAHELLGLRRPTRNQFGKV